MLRVIILLSLVMLTACTGRNHSFDLTKPISLNMNPPEGPPNYQQGWSDGCESSLASTNTNLQLLLKTHQYTIDPQAWQRDWLYRRAWNYGYRHCGFSMKSLERYKL
jgi:hypothetical protein